MIYFHATIFVIQNFAGNKDQDSVVYHEFNPPIMARFIRLLPQEWVGHISMRVELYGCQGIGGFPLFLFHNRLPVQD